mmetsp:Transcript_36004/g.103472  ORF Transcript_36004/g.103472 Transcript_36004/m.103472 type:complete len:100 (+) Transcript_36004:458-757(+)
MLHSEARRVLRHPTATVTDDLFMASVDQLFVPVRKVREAASAVVSRHEAGRMFDSFRFGCRRLCRGQREAADSIVSRWPTATEKIKSSTRTSEGHSRAS